VTQWEVLANTQAEAVNKVMAGHPPHLTVMDVIVGEPQELGVRFGDTP
jgi:hypothetical protein